MKVVLVDDEKIVRLGLMSIVEWEKNGFELTGVFDNGNDALEFCLRNPPDIVITDIKMQPMDGLRLTHLLKQALPQIDIIALSNYDDFTTVHDSYQKGVTDYILKRYIDPESIVRILKDIRHKHGKSPQENKRLPGDEACASVLQALQELWSHIDGINSMKQDSHVSLLLSEIATFFGDAPSFFCIAVEPFSVIDGHYQPYDSNTTAHDTLTNFVTDPLQKYADFAFMRLVRSGLFIGVCFFQTPNTVISQNLLSDLSKDLSQTLDNYFSFQCTIGFSQIQKKTEHLCMAIQQCALATQQRFFQPEQTAFRYEAQCEDEAEFLRLVNELTNRLHYLVSGGNLAAAQDAIWKLCHWSVQNHRFPAELFRHSMLGVCHTLCMLLLQKETGQENNPITLFRQQFTELMASSRSIHEILKKLPEVFHLLTQNTQPENNQAILIAEKYIRENYMQNITLQEISNLTYMNSDYFCSLFKQKTGQNFVTYLRNIRIKKAIELLQTTSLSTSRIGELVGYKNPNYFAKVFKSVTNQSVTAFRK